MKLIQSPLRYPGSKSRIAEMIAVILEQNLLVGAHIYEPFAGGSGVSLNLLANNFVRSATWVELDPMIYSFWVMVRDRPKDLISRIKRARISLTTWRKMLCWRDLEKPTKSTIPDLGFAGLFFNRTCFSGIVGAGPIGGMTQSSPYKIDCRFNKDYLENAILETSMAIQNVEIIFGDGIKFLRDNSLRTRDHSFAYIDPPYVTNGYKLYRYHFDNEKHAKLAEAIDELCIPWLLSYDNHKMIQELYRGEKTKLVKTYHSLKGSRFVKEVLLLSDDFSLKASSQSKQRQYRGRAEFVEYDS